MKKSLLVVALGSVFAAGTASALEVEKDFYVGAELGGNVLVGDQTVNENGVDKDADIEYWNMVKVGGDAKFNVHREVKLLVGGEAQVAYEGIDDASGVPEGFDNDHLLVKRMTVGAETRFGTTTFGKQEGILDAYTDFADLSKEHGLDSGDIESNSQFNHVLKGKNFEIGFAADFEDEYYGVAGSYTHNIITFGGSVVDYDSDSKDETMVDLGAVLDLGKVNVAGKYFTSESDLDGDKSKTDGYSISADYQFNSKLSLATSFNVVDATDAFGKKAKSDDEWGTVGASYAYNQHVEFVTEYKFASEVDDKVFLRANINF